MCISVPVVKIPKVKRQEMVCKLDVKKDQSFIIKRMWLECLDSGCKLALFCDERTHSHLPVLG